MAHGLAVLLAATLAALASGVPLSVENCPSQLTRDNYLQVFGDYCYEFVMYKSLEFDDAKKECEKKSGSLVKIPNSGVQNFLQGKLRATYFQTSAVWIGLTDHNSDDKWEWVADGTQVTDYDNWAPGQPGVAHGLGFEDCAAMEPTENGRWHDYRCTDFLFVDFGHPYICQYGPIFGKGSTMQTKSTARVTRSTATRAPGSTGWSTSRPTMPATTMPKSTRGSSAMPKSTRVSSAMPKSTRGSSAMPKSTMISRMTSKKMMSTTPLGKRDGRV